MADAKTCAAAVTHEVGKRIIGKRSQLELILTAVFSGGHVLLEDLPGSGKTTLIKALGAALGCSTKRIQFTPDLLPSDILGTNIYSQKEEAFKRVPGPIHTNLLLADEINRAIPRTQSALLEAMEECQVTIDGVSYPLPEPFFVMATQNPVEKESTFPLPAAQMDRFFIRLSLGYPDKTEEAAMLTDTAADLKGIEPVMDPERFAGVRAELEQVTVSDMLVTYIVELVHSTREHKALKTGASPRASRSLYQGSRALAAIRGRNYVTPEDIRDLAVPVLAHRVQLSPEAVYSGRTAEECILSLLEKQPVPPFKEQIFYEG